MGIDWRVDKAPGGDARDEELLRDDGFNAQVERLKMTITSTISASGTVHRKLSCTKLARARERKKVVRMNPFDRRRGWGGARYTRTRSCAHCHS